MRFFQSPKNQFKKSFFYIFSQVQKFIGVTRICDRILRWFFGTPKFSGWPPRLIVGLLLFDINGIWFKSNTWVGHCTKFASIINHFSKFFLPKKHLFEFYKNLDVLNTNKMHIIFYKFLIVFLLASIVTIRTTLAH